MSQDPYTTWLDVPAGPRPPHHYALLGLPLWTAAPEQIEAAAYRQLEKLDRHALHPDAETRETCTRLMNEVARARTVLMDDVRRRAYDKQLVALLGGKATDDGGAQTAGGANSRSSRRSAAKRAATADAAGPGDAVADRSPGRAHPAASSLPRHVAWMLAGALAGGSIGVVATVTLWPSSASPPVTEVAPRATAAPTADRSARADASGDPAAEPELATLVDAAARAEADAEREPEREPEHASHTAIVEAAPADVDEPTDIDAPLPTPAPGGAATGDMPPAEAPAAPPANVRDVSTERSAYAYHLAQAMAAFESGQTDEARRHLDLCPESQRHWEWYRLEHLLDGSYKQFDIEVAETARFTPEGDAVLVGHQHGVLKFDLQTGATEVLVDAPQETSRLTDVDATGRFALLRRYRQDATGREVSWSVVQAGSSDAWVDLDESEVAFDTSRGASIQQRWLSASTDGPAVVWNGRSGQPLAQLQASQGFGHMTLVHGGQRVVGLQDGRIGIWDAQSGDLLEQLPGPAEADRFAEFSEDASHVVIARGRAIEIWDVASSRPITPSETHDADITALALLPDRGLIVSGDIQGELRVWSTDTGEVRQTVRITDEWIHRITPALRTGHVLIQTGSRQVSIWRIDSDESEPLEVPSDVYGNLIGAAVQADGQGFVLTTTHALLRVDRQRGLWQVRVIHQLPPMREQVEAGDVSLTANLVAHHVAEVIPTPGGGWRRDADGRQWLRLFDNERGTESGTVELSAIRSAGTPPLALTPDGRMAAHVDADEVKVIDLSDGSITARWTARPLAERPERVRFSDSGRFLLAEHRRQNEIRVRDVASGAEVHRLPALVPHLQAMAVDANDTRLAMVGQADRPIIVHDLESGAVIATLAGHRGSISSLAFSPDGERLAAAGTSGKVYVWDLQRSQLTHRLRGHAGPIRTIAFHPDGAKLVSVGSTGDDGRVRLWRLDDAEPRRLTISSLAVGHALPEQAQIAAMNDAGQIAMVVHPEEEGEATSLYVVRLDGDEVEHHFTLPGSLQYSRPWMHRGQTPVALSDSGRWFAAIVQTPAVSPLSPPVEVLKIFDLQGDQPPRRISLPDTRANVRSRQLRSSPTVRFSPDDRLLMVGLVDGLRVLDVETGEHLFEHARPLGPDATEAAVSADGRTLIFHDTRETLSVYDFESGERERVYVADALPAWPRELLVAPDGRHLLVVTRRAGVLLVDLSGQNEPRPLDMGGTNSQLLRTLVLPMTFSSDGRRLMLRQRDDLLVWDTQDWRLLARYDMRGTTSMLAWLQCLIDDHLVTVARHGRQLEILQTSRSGPWPGVAAEVAPGAEPAPDTADAGEAPSPPTAAPRRRIPRDGGRPRPQAD